MIGSGVGNLLPVVEMALIARLGTNAIAAMGIVGMLLSLIYIYNEPWGTGSVIVLAQHLGARELDRAQRVLKETVYGKFLGASMISLICLAFLRPILVGFGARPELISEALRFGLPALLAIPFAMIGYSSFTFFRATGQTTWAMWFMMLQTALNLLLDIVLIPGLGPLPKLGLAGAGWASLTSWLLTDVGAYALIATPKFDLPTNVLKGIRLTSEGVNVFRVGFYAGLSNLSSVVANVLTQRIINAVSIPVFAAMQVFNRILQIPNTVVWSVVLISTPVMAQNVGARLHHRVRTFLRYCLRFGTLALGAFGVLCVLAPQALMALFGIRDPELAHWVKLSLQVMAFVPLFGYASAIYDSYFQAYRDTRLPFLLNSVPQWLFYIPALYYVLAFRDLDPAWAFWLYTLNALLVLVAHWFFWRQHVHQVDLGLK
ncbi:MATE family efflux transporter [Coprothermobacteraceae bacterium]|nr:MATE family efflux transporter [Coprothermobacteraceae bacterium]